MKRIILLTVFAIGALQVFAQDVKTAKKYLEAKDFTKAKDAIDQAITSDKGAKDWETWFTKAKIYGALAANEATKSLVPDARMQAFEAIKKAFELNNPLATFALAQEGYKPVFNLYEGYYGEGATNFNAEKYEDAFDSYKKANVIGEYINKNGWALSALDTGLVFMIGASANNAKKMEDALTYYTKLVDAKVTNPDYLPAYKFVVYYYKDKKDDASFNKYLPVAKSIFPNEKYFDDVELEYLDEKGDKDALLKKYEEVLAKNPNDYENNFYYGATLFNMIYRDDAQLTNRDELIGKMEKAFQKCIELKPEEMDGYLELGKSHYNLAVEFKDKADAIKPATAGKPLAADQQATKKDLQAKAEKKINDALPYLEKAYGIMDAIPDKKAGQKAKQRSIAVLLRDSYNFINKIDKANFYEKAIDQLK